MGLSGTGRAVAVVRDLGGGIMGDATRIDMTVVGQPTTTDGKGEVETLSGSVDWVHEWQAFWVEIWVSTPNTTTVGVAEAMVDFHCHTGYLTAVEIVHSPALRGLSGHTVSSESSACPPKS